MLSNALLLTAVGETVLILAQCLETIWTKVKVDLDGEMEGEGEADNAEGEEELNLFCDDLEEEWLEEEH